MKKLRTIFIFILFGQITFAQDNSVQKDFLLFEKGYTLQTLVDEDLELNDVINSSDSSTSEKDFAEEIKEIILERALENYQELIDSFPNSKLLYRAMNNKGYIELDLDDIEEAEKTFKKIIDSEADDEEIGGPGLGLMSEPYTNYKNRAAKALANIYLEKEDFAEALKFLDLTKKYPYYHFCGNEYEADEIYMSTLYAKCYIGLKDYEISNIFIDSNFSDYFECSI
jgi:tetratricopeptide (TPR) repeat protein